MGSWAWPAKWDKKQQQTPMAQPEVQWPNAAGLVPLRNQWCRGTSSFASQPWERTRQKTSHTILSNLTSTTTKMRSGADAYATDGKKTTQRNSSVHTTQDTSISPTIANNAPTIKMIDIANNTPPIKMIDIANNTAYDQDDRHRQQYCHDEDSQHRRGNVYQPKHREPPRTDENEYEHTHCYEYELPTIRCHFCE
ncbi:hypothetical protein CDAR_442151 [Caerostris darwini]|uniref:Uncharacterized protein n=1 Tax=Caerostris darwini TaxID=1538125 RepID=A0AAV4V1V4_9ARAC|nr:hypothetical protein CDAR_442151 [Caerostris darwini]